MHANAVSASACEACPPNSNASAGATHCACTPGWYGQPLGSDGATSKNGSGCMPCAPGSFKDATGSHGCIACASGTYSSGVGASTCSTCPAGVDSISIAAEHDLGTLQQCRPEFKLACQEETEPHACFLVQVTWSVSVMACRAGMGVCGRPKRFAVPSLAASHSLSLQHAALMSSIAQFLALAPSRESCRRFNGSMVRVSSSLPTEEESGDNGTHTHSVFPNAYTHAHGVDDSWGALLTFALELTGAKDGFYWAGDEASLSHKDGDVHHDELAREWCASPWSAPAHAHTLYTHRAAHTQPATHAPTHTQVRDRGVGTKQPQLLGPPRRQPHQPLLVARSPNQPTLSLRVRPRRR